MTSRFLNLDRDGTLAANSDELVPSQKAIKTYADNKVLFYGTSTSAAADTEKVVSIPSVDTLSIGTIIIIKPTITSTVANSTIKLNNFSAYPMRYNNAAITTSTDSVVWNAAYPSIWVFDGTYWVFAGHGVDSNTTYSAMSVAEGIAGTATSSRVIRADYLKQIIQNYLANQDVMGGATASADGSKGLVPAPSAGDNLKFLRGDGTWAAAGGSANIDNKSITQNNDSQIQTVGVIDQNNNSIAIKSWTGTRAEYDAIVTKDANTLYTVKDDASVTDTLLQALYPVGSIFITTNDTCPLSTLIAGSSWTLVSSGRVLQGADSSHAAGSTIEAGLPNIQGTVGIYVRPQNADGKLFTLSGTGSNATYTGAYGQGTINFNASGYNSIYGNSDTVQPAAYVVNIFRRVA